MSKDLIIPIYLDTNSLLDLLASIEGGFSIMEKVSTQNVRGRDTDYEGRLDAGTEFGIPNVLSLLKVNLGLSGSHKRSTATTQAHETERYHTYGSLFFRLREYLEDQKLIKRIDGGEKSWQSIQSSDFVEIHGLLQPNPMTTSLQLLERLLTISELATVLQSGNSLTQQSQLLHSQQKSNQQKNKAETKATAAAKITPGIQQIRQFLGGLLADLQNDHVRLFISHSTSGMEFRAVIALFVEYLRDKTLVELSNKEFYLLGKVVRKIDQDKDEPINLLMGTALSGVGDQVLNQLTGAFANMEGVKLPKIETHIGGPALEIVPIAIYV